MVKENRTTYAILGLLSHEDMTGYDIKKRIDTTLKYFWGASFGSIYPTLNELEKNDFIKREEENSKGRAKIIYSITVSGKNHLGKWLRQPVEKDELRYETLLKLFFGSHTETEHSIERIEEFKEKYEKEIPVLQMMVKQLSSILEENADHRFYMLTAMFGEKVYKVYVEWADEAVALLNIM